MSSDKICVLVLASGNIPYKPDSLRVLKHYFRRNSINYVILDNPPKLETRGSHPSWWKLLCHKILPGYDFILNWDLDLLPVSPDVSVIEHLDFTRINMVRDSQVVHKPSERFLPSFKYNGGLLGIPKSCSEFTERVFDKYAPGKYPSYEQYYLNEEIHLNNISIHELPTEFNRLFWDPEFTSAKLKHYTGTHTAKQFIQAHANTYLQPVIFDTRVEMIHTLVPKYGRYCEVGVFAGDLSKELLKILQPEKLYLIDFFEGIMGSGDQDGNNFKYIDLSKRYSSLQTELNSTAVELLKGDSVACMKTLENDSLDMVYIDADHSYEGTLRDLETAYEKVKNGGLLLGHDYEMNMKKAHKEYQFGVRRAVDEFCRNRGLLVIAKGMDGCVSFAIKVYK